MSLAYVVQSLLAVNEVHHMRAERMRECGILLPKYHFRQQFSGVEMDLHFLTSHEQETRRSNKVTPFARILR